MGKRLLILVLVNFALFLSLIGQEKTKLLSVGVEFESVMDWNLADKGGKAIISLPGATISQELEPTHKDVSSSSHKLFLRCSINPAPFISIYGKIGLTGLDWKFLLLNPPGEPGSPPQNLEFKGKNSPIFGLGARSKLLDIVGFNVELEANYLSSKINGQFFIDGVDLAVFEEEQFRIQHGGGTAKYKAYT